MLHLCAMRTRVDQAKTKRDWIQVYQNSEELARVQWHMLLFSCEEFLGAFIIQNIEHVLELANYMRTNPKSFEAKKQFVAEFIFHDLSDSIRICSAFENLLKVELMTRGFIVHKLTKKGNKKIEKIHSKSPIPISFLKLNGLDEEDISTQTISLSDLLGAKYSTLNPFSERIQRILGEINSSRNELHMRTDMETNFSEELVHDLRLLRVEIDKVTSFVERANGLTKESQREH